MTEYHDVTMSSHNLASCHYNVSQQIPQIDRIEKYRVNNYMGMTDAINSFLFTNQDYFNVNGHQPVW